MSEMANACDVELHRAANLRDNLRRIFSQASQAQIAKDAGIHAVHLAKILSGAAPNPTIETIERLSVALEVPVEILLSPSPSDLDLRIFSKKLSQAS
jgi:transcriptional regulator with XRE-family HTH domain